MIFHIVLLAVFGSTYSAPDFHKFIGKYATMQIFSTCFGEEFMTDYYNDYTEAKQFCQTRGPDEYLEILTQESAIPSNFPNLNPNSDDLTDEILKALEALPQDQDYSMMDLAPQSSGAMNEMLNLAQIMMHMQGGSSQPIIMMPLSQDIMKTMSTVQGQFRRQKRSYRADSEDKYAAPYFDEEKILSFYESVRSKAANFTCIMMKLNIYDSNFKINENYLIKKAASKGTNGILRADLSDSVTDCARFSECKPINKMNLIPEAVQQAMSFLRCQIQQELAACVKNDIMQKQHKFDRSALQKLPGDDMDDGDKMYALLFGDLSSRH